MTVEAILKEVEKRLGELDEKAKEAVKLAVKLAQGETLPEQPEPQWQGENPPFDEMAKLDIEERSKIMSELEQRNMDWLLRKCEELGAMWLLVVDGQIYAHGKNLADNPPADEEKLELARRTGKLPLMFIHPALLWIEEIGWHTTVRRDDVYPTLRCCFRNAFSSWETIADFDTGSASTFADFGELERRGIVRFSPSDFIHQRTHLGQTFRYIDKVLRVGLVADDGTEQSIVHSILCVLNWRQSPFVAINPNRTALIGRDICLRLQPKITLNFEAKTTSVAF